MMGLQRMLPVCLANDTPDEFCGDDVIAPQHVLSQDLGQCKAGNNADQNDGYESADREPFDKIKGA